MKITNLMPKVNESERMKNKSLSIIKVNRKVVL